MPDLRMVSPGTGRLGTGQVEVTDLTMEELEMVWLE